MKNIQLAEAILKLVSIRAAGELERQKDLKFLQRNAEIQTVMRQISEAALWDSSLDEFFAAVHRLIGTVLPAENFQIALVDELSGIIVDRFIVDSILTGLQQRPIGTGLTEYTLRQERAVHITQAELLRLRESGEVTRQPRAPIHEWLGVPLVGPTGKGVGIMALIARKADQSFLPEDTGLLSLIAAPVSLAIERKRAEATLASSESRLSRAQAIAHVGNWEIELPTMQVTASVEAFQIYGLEPDTTCLHLQAIQQIVRREDRSRLDRALKGLLDRNEKYDVEFGINRADNGLEKLIHSIAELECDQDGKPKKIIGVIQDITEMKQVEQTLIESEARYRAVMEQAPEAMLLCDPDTWDVVEANSRFTALFGYDLQEKEPLNLIALFVDEPAKIREYIDRLIQTGNLALQRRVCRHRNGSAITVERTATLVKYRGRRLFVMTLRDMSETLRREQAEHHQATHDELTGLYNRRGFVEAVAKKLA
jgi:PAS domain S-box-containing protein